MTANEVIINGARMKTILSGNEAVARGCYEYGLHVATAYPGTPSTEILENVSQYTEIYCEWSPTQQLHDRQRLIGRGGHGRHI